MRLILAAALAAMPVCAHAQTVDPTWSRQPTMKEMMEYFPPEAAKKGVSGTVLLQCGVTTEGRAVGCRPLSEGPDGYHFGEAAVQMSQIFEFSPKRVDGQPAPGVVKVPITFHAESARGKTNVGRMLLSGAVSFAVSAATGGVGGMVLGAASGTAAGMAVPDH